MNKAQPSDEDKLDRIYQLVSISLLFVGLAFAASATNFTIDQEGTVAQVISSSRYIFLIVISTSGLLSVWKSYSLRRSGSILHLHDGFIYRAYVQAITISCTTTFAAIVFLMELLEDTSLPPKFYMRCIGAIMLCVFSISYLVISNVSQSENQGEMA